MTDPSPLATLPLPLVLALIAFFGACIGSFLTLVTYRLPLDIPIGMTRSRCPSCKTDLKPLDLVPVFSWIFNKGRCRHCKTKVSFRYPLTEIACAAGGLFAFYHFGFSWQAVGLAGLWWCIVAIIITDLEHTIILDEVQIATALFGVLFGAAGGVDYWDMLQGAAWGAGIGLTLKYGFIYLRNKDGLGMGDVKFLAAAGVWLASGPNFVPFLFISGIFGIISGVSWRLAGLDERFPFGPALALALFLGVVWPQSMNGFWNLYGLLH